MTKLTDRQVLDAVYPDEPRCTVCGWPLVLGDGLEPLGCVEGSCSQRPAPKTSFADQLRHAKKQAEADKEVVAAFKEVRGWPKRKIDSGESSRSLP